MLKRKPLEIYLHKVSCVKSKYGLKHLEIIKEKVDNCDHIKIINACIGKKKV